jgi:hypothetical protein
MLQAQYAAVSPGPRHAFPDTGRKNQAFICLTDEYGRRPRSRHVGREEAEKSVYPESRLERALFAPAIFGGGSGG